MNDFALRLKLEPGDAIRDAQALANQVKRALSGIKINGNLIDLGDSSDQVQDLTAQVLKAKAALSSLKGAGSLADPRETAELSKQAAVFEENLRFKRQLAQIDGAGFSDKDANNVRALAKELNSINLKRIEGEFDNAGRSARGFQSILEGIGQSLGQRLFNTAENALSGTISFIGRNVSESIDAFAAYDESLAVLAGRANVSRDALTEIEAAIQEVAATTTQSPEGVAELAVQLQALGASTEELPDLITQVARAADALGQDPVITGQIIKTATNVFGDFGLTAEDAANKIAKLAASSAALSSPQGIQEFQQLLQDAGATAVAAGVDFDELGASFAVLRDAGFNASIAGTAIKTALLSISSPSGPAAGAMKQVGFEAFDAAGNFVGLEEAVRRFGEATAGLNQEDQLNIATTIFGREGAPGVLALLNEVDGRFTKLVNDARNNSATAIDDALAARAESLSFQGQLLQGSLESLALQFGGAIAPALTEILQVLNQIFEPLAQADVFAPVTASAQAFADSLKNNPELIADISNTVNELFNQISQVTAATIDLLTGLNESGAAENNFENLAQGIEATGETLQVLSEGLSLIFSLSSRVADAIQLISGNSIDGLIELAKILQNVANFLDQIAIKISSLPILDRFLGGDQAVQTATELASGVEDINSVVSGLQLDSKFGEASDAVDRLASSNEALSASGEDVAAASAMSLEAIESEIAALEERQKAASETNDDARADSERQISRQLDDERRARQEANAAAVAEIERQNAAEITALEESAQARIAETERQGAEEIAAFEEAEQSRLQQLESDFNTQQEAAKSAFQERRLAREQAFNDAQEAANQQQAQNYTAAERIIALQGAQTAADRQNILDQARIANEIQSLDLTQILNPEELVATAQDIAGVGSIQSEEDAQRVQQVLGQLQQEQDSQRQAAAAEAERQLQAQLQAEEAKFDAAQAEQRLANEALITAQRQALETEVEARKLAFEATVLKPLREQTEAEIQALKTQQEAELAALRTAQADAERALDRQFEDEKIARDRAYREEQRQLDLANAREIEALRNRGSGSGSNPAPAGRRGGGPVTAGTPYMVGEAGPELIIPASDGHVWTARQTAAILRNAVATQGNPSIPTSGRDDGRLLREVRALRSDLQKFGRPQQSNTFHLNTPKPLQDAVKLQGDMLARQLRGF